MPRKPLNAAAAAAAPPPGDAAPPTGADIIEQCHRLTHAQQLDVLNALRMMVGEDAATNSKRWMTLGEMAAALYMDKCAASKHAKAVNILTNGRPRSKFLRFSRASLSRVACEDMLRVLRDGQARRKRAKLSKSIAIVEALRDRFQTLEKLDAAEVETPEKRRRK